MSSNIAKIAKLELDLKTQLTRIPVVVGNAAVNFSKDNFRRQAFSGEVAWQGRHFGGRGAILVKSGDLRRSIRIIEI
jgi:phage gpG-like protein